MTAPTPQDPEQALSPADEDRKAARKRLEDKRKFRSDVVAYVLVNTFLVLVWALGEQGAFWPGWVMAGWGVMLLLDYYRVFMREPITEADVDAEVRRGRPAG